MISAVILAAGEGSRMGGLPKCLIRIDHQIMLIEQISTLRRAGVELITVVTGFYHEQIEAVIAEDVALHVVRNKNPEQGQQSSVRLGLSSLQGHPDLVLIALADQPLVDENDLRELLQAFCARPSGTEILYPVVNGQRGNPVMMSAAAVSDFLQDSSDITCRTYIDQHALSVHKYLTKNDHFIADLDTHDDLIALQSRTGLNISV